MNLLEETESLSPPARSIAEGLLRSVRQKWIENTETFLVRAHINAMVAKECATAGFSAAAGHFATKAIYLFAQAFECLASAERYATKRQSCAAVQLQGEGN